MSKKRKYEKVLFVSDIHAPFQDNQAIRALIAFGKEFKPDRIVFMGDVVDFYSVSSFDKDPIRALQLQEEIDVAVGILKVFRKEFPDVKMDFIRGNHERRLQKYIWKKAPALTNMRDLTVQAQLQLDVMDITYHKTGRMILRGIVVKHGDIVRKHSSYTAKGELEDTGISGVSAHTHRMGLHCHTNRGGRHFWYEVGCLCKMNAEYMEGKMPNWQQGFAAGYFKKGSKKCNIQLIPILNGKALFGEKEYFGRKK